MNLVRALLEAIANKKPLKEVYQEIPQSLERHLGMIREALRKSPSPEFGEVEDDWDLFVEFTLGEFPHSVIIANFHDRDKDGEPKRFLAELGLTEDVSTIAPITKGTERTYEKEGGVEMNLTLDLPEELAIPLSVAGYDVEKLTEEAKRLLAVTLFQRHTLSLGQAAKLAEMHLWDFIQLLSQQGITIAEYDDAEIQQELESAEWLH